ncbi:STAS domain-containing protein [Mycolicibacterium komossense]|uniref:STAS domain-containing protein n=1 Tax=Mycolicibacterium komossense TaxID=1779 RepID=A0ABT3CEJ9_9MYCO|nr:STAS domain-containing protein [Mycolicibacterium komossense]MCV7227910.1 STAS domain-containing protein [Mycolicibacterium komossense]
MSDPSLTHAPLSDCTVDQTWSGSTAVLAVIGTVDMLTMPKLQAAIESALAAHPSALIVDLTEVDFLASHGMRVLIDAHDGKSPETEFLVVAEGPITARPMILIGLTELISVYPTLNEALLRLAA